MRHLGKRRALQQLLKKYKNQTASDKEQRFVEWYFHSFEGTPDFLTSKSTAEKDLIEERLHNKIKLGAGFNNTVSKTTSVKKIVALCSAAAAVILVFAGLYFFKKDAADNQKVVKKYTPAIEKAFLTTANGEVSSLANQDLRINLGKSNKKKTAKFNYVSIDIPKGCRYHFTLEDGTEVWLSPGSKMHIPLDYGKTNRTVRLWGEGYFIVKHLHNLPFHVQTNSLDIKDIGTEFKVSAYPDQKISVTLAKGSLVVYDSISHKNFSLDGMGEQVLMDPLSKTANLQVVDTAFATSIKNNLFYFDHASISQVTHEISQWYNVEFKLEGNLNDVSFTGSIRRDCRLDDIIKIFELSNLQCRMQADMIVITPGKLAPSYKDTK